MFSYKDYIYAIYQERSFSKAAQKLFVSQSWLSSVVKKTEQEIKAPLFDRSTVPISMTEAGLYYIRQAEKIMAVEEETRRHFQEFSAGMELHIGSSMFFCTYVFLKLLKEFQEQNPSISLSFTEGSSSLLAERLLSRSIDLILVAEPIKDPRILSTAWAYEAIILAVPVKYEINRELSEYCYSFDVFLKRNEPGQKKPPVPLKLFQDVPFLLLKPGNDIYQRSITLCSQAGFTPKSSIQLAQMMTAYYLVCEGQGISFLRSTIPEYVAPTDRVVFYQLESPSALRPVFLSRLQQDLSPAQQKLADFIWDRRLIEHAG